jgi:DNA helicase II / ATP-dependent DNA helicase PcrA
VRAKKSGGYCYVAMTRARYQLHLMLPQRFFTHGQRSLGDRHVYAQRTRFIPDAITRHFESRTWAPSFAQEAKTTSARKPVDVQARMRRMWT